MSRMRTPRGTRDHLLAHLEAKVGADLGVGEVEDDRRPLGVERREEWSGVKFRRTATVSTRSGLVWIERSGRFRNSMGNGITWVSRLARVHEEPEDERAGGREELRAEPAAKRDRETVDRGTPIRHQATSWLQRRAEHAGVDVARDAALAHERDFSLPPPRPSMTTASVSSVRPIAARWRVPSVLLTFGLVVSGKRQPAATSRP